jgi:ketosteroid isomerase-like protein
MPEESTTPNVVELTRRMMEAANRHDLGTHMQFQAPDAVWDLSEVGLGTYEGAAAIGGLLEDWWGTWGSHLIEVEEALDLGNGVVFSSQREDSRLAGSEGHVEQRVLWVIEWDNGVVKRQTVYRDIEQARATAERLAEERG